MRCRVRGAALVATLVGAIAAEAQTRLVIVSGLGGQPKYSASFAAWSNALAEAAKTRAGLPDSMITWLGDPAGPKGTWYRGPSVRDTIELLMSRIAARPVTEQVVLVLIGHGSGEDADTKISLPGPDLAARDFARILGGLGSRRVAFLNLTSASGDMAEVLAAPGRVVITATKSAFERNESLFADHFVAAFAQDGADTDKDDRVSLLEAFAFAQAETKRVYENDGRMQTEHAQLVDRSGVARQFFLTPGASGRAGGNAALTALYADREALDAQIQALKAKKAGMATTEYEAELERLLLELARKSIAIRQLEGRP